MTGYLQNEAVLHAKLGGPQQPQLAMSDLIRTAFARSKEKLSAARTLYVRTDGSDSNDGLTNEAGGAFLTIQAAINAALELDFNGFDVTVKVADGTYAEALNVPCGWVGRGSLIIEGNTTTPANCIISATDADAFYTAGDAAAVYFKGFKVQTTGGWSNGIANYGITYLTVSNINYGACVNAHLYCGFPGAQIARVDGAHAISGAAVYHIQCVGGGYFQERNITVAVSGSPAFSGSFIYVGQGGVLESSTVVYTGTPTGIRYNVAIGGHIVNYSADPAYYPGNSAGITDEASSYNGNAALASRLKLLAADVAGADSSTAQPWFPSAGGTTLEVGTYEFEGHLFTTRAAGAVSHTTGLILDGTAVTSLVWMLSKAKEGDANDLQDISGFRLTGTTLPTTEQVVKAASTSTTENIIVEVKGFLTVTTAGTFIPKFKYSAAPGGAPTVKAGTFFKLTKLVSNPIGTWS